MYKCSREDFFLLSAAVKRHCYSNNRCTCVHHFSEDPDKLFEKNNKATDVILMSIESRRDNRRLGEERRGEERRRAEARLLHRCTFTSKVWQELVMHSGIWISHWTVVFLHFTKIHNIILCNVNWNTDLIYFKMNCTYSVKKEKHTYTNN